MLELEKKILQQELEDNLKNTKDRIKYFEEAKNLNLKK